MRSSATADDAGDTGWGQYFGMGIVDAYESLFEF